MASTPLLWLSPAEVPPLPPGWQALPTEQVVDAIKPGPLYENRTVQKAGAVPVVSQSETEFLGYHNDAPGVIASLHAPVVTFTNHTCALRLMKRPFSCIQNVFPKVGRPGVCDTTFFYYAAQNRVVLTDYKGHHPLFRQAHIPVPPLPIQRRIASILSAYDDLIENNRKRIAILEEMSRRLYREWFVHFRYPGHESIPLIDSPLGRIPQGWEVKRVDAICRAVLDGDWVETKDQGGSDFRLLQISNIGLGDFVETGNYRCVTQATFDRLRCTEILPDDLLVARMPTPIGRAWLARKMPWRMITAVDVAIVRPDTSFIDPVYLLHFWNQPAILALIEKQSSGTTRLRITRRELCALLVPIPSRGIQGLFAERVRPMLDMINNLRDQIGVLRRTRDLILPRLMSGQLSVTAAEAAVP